METASRLASFFVVGLMVFGCFYDTDGEPAIVDAAANVDTDTDTDSDTDSDAGVDGMGEICSGDQDCAQFETADFCAVNPLTQEGNCTVADCVGGDCPDTYLCCDCIASGVFEKTICADEANAGSLVSMAGCTCE